MIIIQLDYIVEEMKVFILQKKIILYQNLYHIKCYRKLGTSVIPLNWLVIEPKRQKFDWNNQATFRENKPLSRLALPSYELDKNEK